MRYIIDTDDLLESIGKIPKTDRENYYRKAFSELHEGRGNYPWVTKVKSVTKKGEKYSEVFENFWSAYPKKIGKGAAYKEWQKVSGDKSTLLARCLKALQWQIKQDQWIRDDGEFIPHPRTYLSQSRWEDECPSDIDPNKAEEYYTDLDGIRRKR